MILYLFSWNEYFCFRYYDLVRDVRQNKGSILKASVEYIRKLKTDQCKKRILEEKVKQQDSQNRKLLLKLQVIYGLRLGLIHIPSYYYGMAKIIFSLNHAKNRNMNNG